MDQKCLEEIKARCEAGRPTVRIDVKALIAEEVHCGECVHQEYCRQHVIVEGADSVHPITFCSYREKEGRS